MNFFDYRNRQLCAEQVPLAEIAQQFGTPSYVYSRAAFEQHWHALNEAFGDYPHSIYYAVKANSNLAVLNLLARLGSGFDIVSEGELRRVILAGGDPGKVVFSGVAKSHSELRYVIESGIHCINVESVAELQRIQAVAAELGRATNIALRVNPDVDAQTHPYIATGLADSKFGIAMQDALASYQLAASMPNLKVHSVTCHIGSQITKLGPFKDAVERVMRLVKELTEVGIELAQIDLGGGLGVTYQDESPPSAKDYIQALLETVAASGVNLPVSIEPGRYIAANAGVLLTRVEYLKHNGSKNFAIVDAGMNDLLRPSLYQAYHQIDPVTQQAADMQSLPSYDVVGPVCESSDVLGYDRHLQVAENDLLAVRSAGAYGYTMASNYNSRTRPAELMVDGSEVTIVKQRETFEDITRGETVLP
jgi:diaminopimelate decarboxylase